MPGRRLNDLERRLETRWKSGAGFQSHRLTSLEIAGNNGIRGLKGVALPFKYPLTAICGTNGVGKSTILALAALGFHSPAGWFVHWGVGRGQPISGDRSYYRFLDFFQASPDDPAIANVSITWRYATQTGEQSHTMVKSGNGWGRYSRRPTRHVDLLPLTRILPAVETSKLTKAFLRPRVAPPATPLGPEYLLHLNNVLGRNYTSAEVLVQRGMLFPRCRIGQSSYSAFNMGAGEAAVIGLLYILERLPEQSLLVLEEIEAGLHPQAHQRLAQVLLAICDSKRLQIICSSHSEQFLDAIPRQARLLIRRSGQILEVIEKPSTRYAIATMLGVAQSELVLYCEDSVAEQLIRAALPNDLVSRLRIVVVGSDATVISQGVSHIRSGSPEKVLCVLDGDASAADIQGWLNSYDPQRRWIPQHVNLPGNLMPERWVLEMLRRGDYIDSFARELRCSRDHAVAHVEAMTVVAEQHNIWHELHRRTQYSEVECMRFAARAVTERNPALDPLRTRVSDLLTN